MSNVQIQQAEILVEGWPDWMFYNPRGSGGNSTSQRGWHAVETSASGAPYRAWPADDLYMAD